MPNIDLYNQSREKVGTLELDATVFGAEVRDHLLFAAVKYQLAARRQGTHKVKERAEVQGGGRKPWKQKGTGRARQGSTRAPNWRGGGVIHGPRPHSHAFKLNKQTRRAALRCALSRRVAENAVFVLDDLTFPEMKTKQVKEFLARFELGTALIVTSGHNVNVEKSARNLGEVTVMPTEGVNVYDVLLRRHLVMTRSAVEALTQRLAG